MPFDRAPLVAALRDATPAQLRGYARYLAQVEERLDANGPLLATDTRGELYGLRQCYRTLAALALAVAEISDREDFHDLIHRLHEDTVTVGSFPAALAALLSGGPDDE